MIEATRAGGVADASALGKAQAPRAATPGAAPPSKLADVRVHRVEAGEPPVDAARVARLAAAIAAGEYRVEPDRIAMAMLDEIGAQ